ncbi:MAG: SDR family NAD(P)-dependent oxidoreductase [Halobacteriaceae archaeon]
MSESFGDGFYDLDDKTAIVTGGAGSTGTAVSVELARHGANIIIAQRSEERPNRVVERIRELGGRAAYVPTDLADDRDIVSVVEAATDEFGGVEIVVNNAVHTGKDWAKSMSRDLWESILSVSLTGPFRLAQEAYPTMVKSGYGRVVNMGAIQHFAPIAGSVAYAAAKAGLEGFTRSLAVEWGGADADITANTIHVGPVPGGDWDDRPVEVANDDVDPSADEGALTLVGRKGRPSDIANAAAFLASPRASFITGESIRVDGGRLISRKPADQSHMD